MKGRLHQVSLVKQAVARSLRAWRPGSAFSLIIVDNEKPLQGLYKESE